MKAESETEMHKRENILTEVRTLKVANNNQHWMIERLKFQRVINAQKRMEIGARTLDMLDEYEMLSGWKLNKLSEKGK